MIALQIKVKKKNATKLNRKLTIGKRWKKRAPDKLSINEEEIKKRTRVVEQTEKKGR